MLHLYECLPPKRVPMPLLLKRLLIPKTLTPTYQILTASFRTARETDRRDVLWRVSPSVRSLCVYCIYVCFYAYGFFASRESKRGGEENTTTNNHLLSNAVTSRKFASFTLCCALSVKWGESVYSIFDDFSRSILISMFAHRRKRKLRLEVK